MFIGGWKESDLKYYITSAAVSRSVLGYDYKWICYLGDEYFNDEDYGNGYPIIYPFDSGVYYRRWSKRTFEANYLSLYIPDNILDYIKITGDLPIKHYFRRLSEGSDYDAELVFPDGL